jgi:hypothetical protein
MQQSGGTPAAGGYPASQLSTLLNSLGTLPQGGGAASQLFGGGQPPPATNLLFGGPAGAPGGGAASQLYGQFNPASQNFPGYLQDLMRRRGRR